MSSAAHSSLVSDPASAPKGVPAPIRALAWGVYVVTLGLLAWAGAMLAYRQVPPRDPAMDGPIPPGTRVALEVFAEDYPLARDQKTLRDYVFTLAAGQEPEDDWIIRYAGEFRPRNASTTPDAGGTGMAVAAPVASVEIVKYDGDLVRLRFADEEYWGPKAPLEESMAKNTPSQE